MLKSSVAVVMALAALGIQATTALACGGLVAPDGDVRLAKATTFVAWDAGVEHYVTSFAYQGRAVDVGWIVPLPAVPQDVGAAGRWTLQRLELEVRPPERALLAAPYALAASGAVVLEQVQVEALDVTVLKGSGEAVIGWCAHNGFALNQETRDHLLRYAAASPVFLAAKYDTSAAQRRGLAQGDGVPLMVTMRTPRLWVPLEVLANDNSSVNADLFLLTPERPSTSTAPPSLPVSGSTSVDGAPGFVVAAQEQMNPPLHADLSRDRNMSWVPSGGWLTYLTLNAPSEQVTYDLSVGGDGLIRLDAFGGGPADPALPSGPAVAPALAAAGGAVSCVVLLAWIRHRRRSRPVAC